MKRFLIEANAPVSKLMPIFLRQHDDGALSWTRDDRKAHAFADKDAAAAFARAHVGGDVAVCEVIN